MPRKKLIRSSCEPYHVTGRTNNREAFPCSMKDAWKYFSSELMVQVVLRQVKVHAFVLMPNHFHLLLTTPEGNIDRVMQEFMSSTTRIINTKSGRSGHMYGGPYYWSLITNPYYFAHAYKYVYRNPVKAELSKKVEEFEWSTINTLLGNAAPSVTLSPPPEGIGKLISDDPLEQLEWLNRSYAQEEDEAIGKALQKKVFKFAPNLSTRKPIRLENAL
jgi:putative transposase